MSPIPGFGHRAYLQTGAKEAAFGVFQTPTQKLAILSWKMSLVNGLIPDNQLWSQYSRRAKYQGTRYYKGTFSVMLNYEGLLELLRGVYGTYAATTVEGTSRDHTFKEAGTGGMLNAYTHEVYFGDIPSGKVFRQLGTKLLGIKIMGKAANGPDGALIAEFTAWARELDTAVGAGYTPTGALSFPSNLPVLFNQCVIADDGTGDASSSVRIHSFEFTLTQPHEEERNYLTGGFFLDEPLRSDFIEPEIKFTQEYLTTSAMEVARQFVTGIPRLIFQHPTAIVTHTSSTVTVNAGNTITRGAGSFVSDGWVIGDSVDASAFVPIGTYVTNVAALTLTVSKVCTSSGGSTTVTGGTRREFEVRLGNAYAEDDPTPPIENFGALITTSTWRGAYASADSSASVLRVRSTEAVLP